MKKAAAEMGIPVAESPERLIGAGAEAGIVVAYGRLIKRPVLEALPMLNLHFSLLPRWRGAAPVERAILAGDEETGVCLMGLEEDLDTGPVYRRAAVRIGDEETASELRERLAGIGCEILVEALSEGVQGLGAPVPQKGEPTYAAKIDPEELRLEWGEPAEKLGRVVRAGRAWTTFRGGRLLISGARVARVDRGVPLEILPSQGKAGNQSSPPGLIEGTRVLTGSGYLQLIEVKPEGRGSLPAETWLRGARLRPGDRFV